MAKYPRTFHLPWSPGATRDDRIQKDVTELLDEKVIITEKMDGSNVCLRHDGVFARSHSGPPNHPSFDPLKSLHAALKHDIPEDREIFGEWCYAKHSIEYSKLPSYFMCFGVREAGVWRNWPKVQRVCKGLDLEHAPVLYEGTLSSEGDLQKLVQKLAGEPSFCGGEREGLVVRVADDFTDDDFDRCVLKYVRADHVQTDVHWKHKEIVKNKLCIIKESM